MEEQLNKVNKEEEWLFFHGNKQLCKADKDGYMEGDRAHAPVSYRDIDEYIKIMKERDIGLHCDALTKGVNATT